MARPNKIEWPISFEELLRYAFVNKRPKEREKFYRLFLRDYLHKGTTIKATPEEIETALAVDRQSKFDENKAFHIRMWSVMSFENWKKENIKIRMRNMARSSWSNEARTNRLKK